MLDVVDIKKEYVTGDLIQTALDGVTLNLRDSEFVAVLGPSGSGKTTLLNIIGGLDRYDSGDLIVNGVSTKDFTDRDWDTYRNHFVGFVFQSYNLISHQSVLANVELALTISGISKTERRQRAREALESVGLGDQTHKRPNQLSGGQMQRVAIARALVNDPEVLLADEPTGALDSVTSKQIMELLKEVAKDRLVVMVTHNGELAEEYATRIVTLRDGKVTSDSNPFTPVTSRPGRRSKKSKGSKKASMSFWTSLSLSFNNLLTKKGRTFLTSFAGSIGIIGIALILSLSNGVKNYIGDIQRETMVAYPISINAQALDLSGLMGAGDENTRDHVDHELDGVHSNSMGLETASTMVSSISVNNLTAFKEYLDDPSSPIHQYLGEHGAVYSYPVSFAAYSYDPDGVLVNSDGSTFESAGSSSGAVNMFTMMTSNSPLFTGQAPTSGAIGTVGSTNIGEMPSTPSFQELIPGPDGEPLSAIIEDNYQLLAGSWPASEDELVLILDQNNEVQTSVLYTLGILPSEDYKEVLEALDSGETPNFPEYQWEYTDLVGYTFKMLTASDYYQEESDGTFSQITADDDVEKLVEEKGKDLVIAGIIKPLEASSDNPMSAPIGYTNLLTNYVVEHTNQSPVVVAQEADPETNILTGAAFSADTDDEKVAEALTYLRSRTVQEKASLARTLMMAQAAEEPEGADPTAGMPGAEVGAIPMVPTTDEELAMWIDNYLNEDPDREFLLNVFETQLAGGTYDSNLSDFGVVDMAAPSSIDLYADSFEDKDGIAEAITEYNEAASTENQITYTDFVGLLMSTVTTIINVISYVLIAFVAVSLVVSSIMIGIITFISVLERTKEIGILRSVGASKRNISEVFNAETLIIGTLSGVLGIGVTLLLLIPANALIHRLTGIDTVSATLPWGAALALVALSMVLTLIAGVIPSRIAAKKDPVAALRMD